MGAAQGHVERRKLNKGECRLRGPLYAAFVLLVANLGAITDSILHPDIPYFDEEHVIVGVASALLTALLIAFLSVYECRYRRSEESLGALNEELSVLHKISSIAGRTIDLKKLSAIVVEALAGLKFVDEERKAGIFVVTGESMRLIPHPAHSGAFVKTHRGMKVGDCLCGIAAKTGQAVVCRDCSEDERHTFRPPEQYPHGHIIIPLKAGGKVVGVLFFYLSSGVNPGEGRLRFLESIGNQIGMAINNAMLYEETRALALHDPLTGLANRRLMDIMLGKSFARAGRSKKISVVMLDIDWFKSYNDKNGHCAGDRLLANVAGVISKNIREADLAARYGGEEFLILLPDADVASAYDVAERLRVDIAAATGITVSAGVASYAEGMGKKEDLIDVADRALYLSKRSGKNRTSLYGPEAMTEVSGKGGGRP